MSDAHKETASPGNQVKTYDLVLPAWHKPTLRHLPEYAQWSGMLSRCRNPNSERYPNYGGRGIKVCKRWEIGVGGLSGFECFLADMGRRPTQKHSIDRKDNNGNYEPSNCKWATNTEQCRNRRSNRLVTYNGETMSMMAMAEKYGISYYVLRNRVSRGWPDNDAVASPIENDEPVVYYGKPYTLRGLARHRKMNSNTLRGRIRKGWSVEAAADLPLMPKGTRKKLGKLIITQSSHAAAVAHLESGLPLHSLQCQPVDPPDR